MMDSGTRLGPYEVVGRLGAGGMGVVYRGRDTRLDRDVAIKVLSPDFLEADRRRARFAREARTISQLTHPNICTLYDVGESTIDDEVVHYIVMELIDGPTLTEVLDSGPLPFQQVLTWGEQVAEALDRAHRKGIVHRDLKPGNVMITPTGAKLLDFGLARELEKADEISSELTLTQEGSVVGTIHYMAPERLEGKPADPRSDIFALGALLFEMVTGKKAFSGETRLTVLTAIARGEVASLYTIDPSIHPAFEHLVRRCLAKDPDERWQSAHDVAAQLRFIAGSGTETIEWPRLRLPRLRKLPRALLLALAVTAGAIGGYLLGGRGSVDEARPLVFNVAAPKGERVDLSGAHAGSIALSPDGRLLVFGTGGGWQGGGQLWLRDLATTDAEPLEGTDGAIEPFWSPNSRQLAFFQEGKLRRIDVTTGITSDVCEAPRGRAGSWNAKDVILFSPTSTSGISYVRASGGKAVELTHLDETVGETTHRSALFLPDGDRFLYLAASHRREFEHADAIYMSSLSEPTKRTRLFGAKSYVAFADGKILYSDGTNLLARRLDARLGAVGDSELVADDAAFEPVFFRAPFTVSGSLLAYQAAGVSRESDLVWISATGAELMTVGRPSEVWGVALSPDATRAILTVPTITLNSTELQLFDLEGGTRVPLGPGELAAFPIWSPDGTRVAYCQFPGGERHIVRVKSLTDVDAVDLVEEEAYVFPLDWSPDGRYLLYALQNPDGRVSVIAVGSDGAGDVIHVAEMPDVDTRAVFVDDGKYVAYVSDSSGSRQIHLVELGSPDGGRWQITDDNHQRGELYHFGRELAYWNQEGQLTAIAIESGSDVPRVAGRRAVMGELSQNDCVAFSVASDGSRALVVRERDDGSGAAITIVQNWTARLGRK